MGVGDAECRQGRPAPSGCFVATRGGGELALAGGAGPLARSRLLLRHGVLPGAAGPSRSRRRCTGQTKLRGPGKTLTGCATESVRPCGWGARVLLESLPIPLAGSKIKGRPGRWSGHPCGFAWPARRTRPGGRGRCSRRCMIRALRLAPGSRHCGVPYPGRCRRRAAWVGVGRGLRARPVGGQRVWDGKGFAVVGTLLVGACGKGLALRVTGRSC
jgi:hypothetical protein